MFHRLGSALGLHRRHQSVHVGNVHEHGHSGWVLWVDERADVGDTEGPEEFLAFGRGKPMLRVLHIVVANYGGHRLSFIKLTAPVGSSFEGSSITRARHELLVIVALGRPAR